MQKPEPSLVPQGRHGLPRQVIDERQRQRLVAAMASVVTNQGYAATSVADVIAVAGMSRTTYYQLFLGKEDCFLAAYDEGRQFFASAMTQARTADASSWRQRGERTLDVLLTGLAAYPDLAHICMVDALGAGPAAVARYRQSVTEFCAMVEQRTGDDVDRPVVPPTVIEALVGGIISVIRTRVTDGCAAELPALLPELTDFYVATFLGYDELHRTEERTQ